MKKALALFFLLAALRVHGAGAVTNAIGGLVSLNGTNTAKMFGGTATFTLGRFYFQNGGGLGSTNAFRGDVWISLDNTNFIYLGTYRPRSTGATNEVYIQPSTNLTFYVRIDAVTTNSYNIGVTYQAP